MKFGSLVPEEAIGAVLAHSVKLPSGKRLRKGVTVDQNLVGRLNAEGVHQITVAKAEPGDVSEDEAAQHIGEALLTMGIRAEPPTTGRVNLFAEYAGLFTVSADLVNALNRVEEGLTLATLPPFTPVESGRLVATVKIIPYFLSSRALEAAKRLDLSTALKLREFIGKRITLISTMGEALKDSVHDKTRGALEARLERVGSVLIGERRVAHCTTELSAALDGISHDVDIVIVFGVSAISDRADVIPSALEKAGGSVIRLGMPVDPGNLLMLGTLAGKPVLGAPGCARSPVENGFDWVLNRLLAGVAPADIDISGMGVGGLLMETVSRPSPRVETDFQSAVIVLAAGQSTRMGNANKLTLHFQGKPMVRHAVEAAQASENVFVVTGHDRKSVENALSDLPLNLVFNPDYTSGMASSLRAGIGALDPGITHACVMLGDMPLVTAEHVMKLFDAARQNPQSIVVSSSDDRRGNPVVFPCSSFGQLMQLEGDMGARTLLDKNTDSLIRVELGPGAHTDFDTPESLTGTLSEQI